MLLLHLSDLVLEELVLLVFKSDFLAQVYLLDLYFILEGFVFRSQNLDFVLKLLLLFLEHRLLAQHLRFLALLICLY